MKLLKEKVLNLDEALELTERVWKIKLDNAIVKKFNQEIDNNDESKWEDAVEAFKALCNEILRADPDFKDDYDEIMEELQTLGSPEDFEDYNDENQSAYEQWVHEFDYIISKMYDYCDAFSIWIDPFTRTVNESIENNDWQEIIELEDYEGIKIDLQRLFYEIDNTVRGAYTKAKTNQELGMYIKKLANELDYFGDSVLLLKEE